MVDTLRKDLRACGIDPVDEEGRVRDFHALSHTFCTLLQKADVAPRIAMHLMRHRDLSLTMKT